jgi:hypothetical protein
VCPQFLVALDGIGGNGEIVGFVGVADYGIEVVGLLVGACCCGVHAGFAQCV